MAEPLLELLVDRISRGDRPSEEELASVDDNAAFADVAHNLILLSKISDYHARLLSDPEQTIVQPAPAPAPLELGSWGPLEIRELLGRGGFGEVYRAFDPQLEREVALKLFRGDLLAIGKDSSRLLDEARQLAKFKHENVVSIYGVETHDGRPGYWMELVEGENLEEVLTRQGPFGAAEASEVGRTLCRALAALHAAGLVHRDVKATNVMRERGGRLVLMDFGTVVSETADAVAQPGISGTPAYMAPEILRGKGPSVATDLYALGVLLFHLSSNSYPREALGFHELRHEDASGQRRHLRDLRPDLSLEFCEVVEKALATAEQERFASAGELEHALAGAGVRAPGASVSRRKLLAVTISAVVLVVALFLVGRGVLRGGASMVADARLYTLSEGQPLLIGDGSTVSVGSPLWMELQPSREAFVYVLNRDRSGEVNLLFPLPGYDTQNPVAANLAQELPGSLHGVRKGWQVTSDAGSEEILVVASADRLVAFEQSLASLPAAGEQTERPALALGTPQIRELLRGVAGTLDLPSHDTSASPAEDVFAAAQSLGLATKDEGSIWMRRLTLQHR